MQNNMSGLLDTVKMMMLMNMKDNNTFNTVCYILLSSFISFIMSNDACYMECEKIIRIFLNYFSLFQPKYNSVILDGKRCLKVTNYLTKTDNLFSNRFSAFWHFLPNGFSPKTKRKQKRRRGRDFCLQMAAVPVRRNYSEEDKN